MRRFKNILFLSNPEIEQSSAIQRAASLARRNGAKLTLLSVIKTLPDKRRLPSFGAAAKVIQEGLKHEQAVLAEELVDKLRREGIDAQARLATGTAFIEVIREVLREQHDLVVLAADGKHSLISRLLGSTSMHLMRKCPCPVWVIKPGRDDSYKRVMAAVDTTNDSWDETKQSINPLILQLSSSLAKMEKSELHVIQVWSVFQEGYLQMRSSLTDQEIRKLRKDTKQDYVHKVDYLLTGLNLDGIGVVRTHLIRSDDPAATIIKLARKEKIDLLVMGTVCRVGLAGFFIGNTAEEVLSTVGCSVLTVKPEGFVSPVTV